MSAAVAESPPVVSTVSGQPSLPALIDARTTHRRNVPIPFAFNHGLSLWLIDIDSPPQIPLLLRPFVSFRADDHLDKGVHGGLRADVAGVLDKAGLGLRPEDRVILLTSPRALGHVVNPLSVYWCLAADGTPRATVLEVHNTYGQRHVYVIGPDAQTEPIAKDFYVSPFNDVSGGYRVRARLAETGVSVSIALEREGEVVFAAGLTGGARPVTNKAILRRVLRYPFASYRVSALIRMHGIRLWLKRLPVHPRPGTQPGAVS
jgi:DUF1365 family protein